MTNRREHLHHIHEFISAIEAERLSKNTAVSYLGDLAALTDYLGRNPIDATPKEIGAFLVNRSERGEAPTTLRRRKATLNSFFKWAFQANRRTDNPMSMVRFNVKEPKRLPTFLTRAETEGIARTAAATPELKRAGEIFEAFYWTGLRLAELLSVTTGNLRGLKLIFIGKGEKERAIDLDPGFARKLFDSAQKGQRLFPYSRETVRRDLLKLGEAAGLDRPLHPHLIRHTLATHLLEGDVNLRVIQEMLGHSSPATTARYAHVTNKAMEAAIKLHPLAKENGNGPGTG